MKDNEEFEISINNLMKEFDTDIIKILLDKFIKQYENYILELDEINNKNFKEYIHKLKGTSGNLSFKNIYAKCIEIEETKENEREESINYLKILMNNLFANIQKIQKKL